MRQYLPLTQVQGISIKPFPNLVNFVPAVAYHFCLNLPAAFSQPGNGLVVQHCKKKTYDSLNTDITCRISQVIILDIFSRISPHDKIAFRLREVTMREASHSASGTPGRKKRVAIQLKSCNVILSSKSCSGPQKTINGKKYIYDRRIYDLVLDYSVIYENLGRWDSHILV